MANVTALVKAYFGTVHGDTDQVPEKRLLTGIWPITKHPPCFHMYTDQWSILDHWSASNSFMWNIKSLAKYPTLLSDAIICNMQ